jgi:hypothetical protein
MGRADGELYKRGLKFSFPWERDVCSTSSFESSVLIVVMLQ